MQIGIICGLLIAFFVPMCCHKDTYLLPCCQWRLTNCPCYLEKKSQQDSVEQFFSGEKKKKKAKKSQKTLTNISCSDPLLVEISNFHQFQPVILCSVRQTTEVLLSCFHFSFIPCFCLSVLLHFFWSLLPCILPSFLRSPLPCPPFPGVWFCSCSSSSIPAPASS